MTKIVKSLAVIAFVAAIAVGATSSFFSDTETSTGNTFTAGSIDLKVDSKCHYYTMNEEGIYVDRGCYDALGKPFGTWGLTDLTSERFFDFADLKPGDKGEDTISLHVYSNDAWACMTVTPKLNDDMTCTEPELADDTTCNEPDTDLWDGDLAQALTGMIWADICDKTTQYPNAYPGDNIYQKDCDKYIGTGIAPLKTVTLPLADKYNNVFTGKQNDPLIGSQNYYIGMSWDLPYATGNAVQSDSYVADISFYTEQSRNNPNFVCD